MIAPEWITAPCPAVVASRPLAYHKALFPLCFAIFEPKATNG
jgi:hypothetical protein